jgi:O-antigen ligase
LYLLLPVVVAGYGVIALFSPGNFVKAGVLAVAATVGLLIYLFPATFLGLTFISIVASPENLLASAFEQNEIRSLHRLALLFVLAVNVWRYGFVLRSNPPIFALLAMFVISLVAADFLYTLTYFQMIKSLIGLVLPFMFLHCVYRRDAIETYLKLIAFLPLFSVVAGLVVQAAGIRPAIQLEYTGAMRLQGMNIAAYLAFFGYAAFFVCLYQVMTTGRRGYYVLAGINLMIILLTGTRMPTLMAAVLSVAVLLFAPQRSFRMSSRITVVIAGLVLMSAFFYVFWPQIEPRIFGRTAAGSAGRDVIWSIYMDAISKNPWFGRGIGSGVVLLPSIDDYRVAFTNAAHNEYLRILMDGGYVGLIMFMSAMAWWVRSECRHMLKEEQVLFIAFWATFLLYSFTGNSLSSPPTLVVFFTVALVVQRARQRVAEMAPWTGTARRMAIPRSTPPSSPQPV